MTELFNAAAYLSDTLVGMLIFGLAVGTKPEPGPSPLARLDGPEIPPGWTYNPSPNRPNVADGTAAAYANSCNPYGVGPNAGTCSDTSHQSRRVCSTFIFTVCGYATVTFGGPGVASSHAYQLWANGQSFDLNRYRMLLSQGYVLMASFPVYKGFMDDVKGQRYNPADYADHGNGLFFVGVEHGGAVVARQLAQQFFNDIVAVSALAGFQIEFEIDRRGEQEEVE